MIRLIRLSLSEITATVWSHTDFMPDDMTGFYAVAFDPKGRLGWKSNKIIDPDGDPGYDGAQIIEVLTEQADDRYLSYLMDMEIPFIIAGETEIFNHIFNRIQKIY